MASLGALIEDAPEMVTDMATVNPDGSYKVSLYHPTEGHPVSLTVKSVLTKGGISDHNESEKSIAVRAIESAYNQLLNNLQSVERNNPEELPIKVDALSAGTQIAAYKILTGKEAEVESVDSESLLKIVELLADGTPLTLATSTPEDTSSEGLESVEKHNLLHSHGYTAVDCFTTSGIPCEDILKKINNTKVNLEEIQIEIYNPHAEFQTIPLPDLAAFKQYTFLEQETPDNSSPKKIQLTLYGFRS